MHAALVEALMGFQFNHVGGGTKTRRPITLHMKYNSGCVQPTCYLMLEDVGEQEVSLEELQVLSSSPCMRCSACAALFTALTCVIACHLCLIQVFPVDGMTRTPAMSPVKAPVKSKHWTKSHHKCNS